MLFLQCDILFLPEVEHSATPCLEATDEPSERSSNQRVQMHEQAQRAFEEVAAVLRAQMILRTQVDLVLAGTEQVERAPSSRSLQPRQVSEQARFRSSTSRSASQSKTASSSTAAQLNLRCGRTHDVIGAEEDHRKNVSGGGEQGLSRRHRARNPSLGRKAGRSRALARISM